MAKSPEEQTDDGLITPRPGASKNLTLKQQNESGSKKKAQEEERGRDTKRSEWGLEKLHPRQMKLLNERLDQFQDKPRNMSEPKMRYVPSADLRPEAVS